MKFMVILKSSFAFLKCATNKKASLLVWKKTTIYGNGTTTFLKNFCVRLYSNYDKNVSIRFFYDNFKIP
jgi:hypothetical protein